MLLDKSDGADFNVGADIDSDYKFFPIGNYNLKLLASRDFGSVEIAATPHIKLHQMLCSASYKWAVLYKYHKNLIKKYADYNVILVDQYGNRTKKQDTCEDVIVTNF